MTQYGVLKSLSYFDLESNSLSGTLPSQYGALRSLSVLDLDSNSLSGTLPSQYGALTSLSVLGRGINSLPDHKNHWYRTSQAHGVGSAPRHKAAVRATRTPPYGGGVELEPAAGGEEQQDQEGAAEGDETAAQDGEGGKGKGGKAKGGRGRGGAALW